MLKAIRNKVRAIKFRLLIHLIKKSFPEGVSYDPDKKIYCYRWTVEAEEAVRWRG